MSMKVLIADPDWRFSRQATAYLESHAHLVVRRTEIPEILQSVSEWQPDLVIVSEQLTEDGLLEDIHASSDRPAVLLVGWMERYDRIWRAWQRGGDELLMKPIFKAQDLQDAIVTAMENAASGNRHQRVAVSA